MPDCPKCGRRMEPFGDRERTVDGGTWVLLWCPACCHDENVFVPRGVESYRWVDDGR